MRIWTSGGLIRTVFRPMPSHRETCLEAQSEPDTGSRCTRHNGGEPLLIVLCFWTISLTLILEFRKHTPTQQGANRWARGRWQGWRGRKWVGTENEESSKRANETGAHPGRNLQSPWAQCQARWFDPVTAEWKKVYLVETGRGLVSGQANHRRFQHQFHEFGNWSLTETSSIYSVSTMWCEPY